MKVIMYPHNLKTRKFDRTRPFPPQSISPIRKLPKASYPSPSEGRETENHNHRKLTNLITWTRARDSSLTHGLGRSPGEGKGNPLQYSCLEHSMAGGGWRATVHGVTKNGTQLNTHTSPMGDH